MSRLHPATYTIPLHRPWWSIIWRALLLRWLRHQRQCVIDELQGYIDAQMKLGPDYLRNCSEQIEGYDVRIALLEIAS